MNINNHLRHVEGIERAIVDQKIDTLVLGLGPTAWLVPWIDRKVIRDIRLWGAHDIERITPVHDLVLFDSPARSNRLIVGTEAFDHIVNSRPDRLWLYDGNAKLWQPHMHYCMENVTTVQSFFVWQNQKLLEGEPHPERFLLEWNRPHTGYVSPIGCTTLAWKEGCRRIGVLGVEMDIDHNTHGYRKIVDNYFTTMADQAHEKGGCIVNLSPITKLSQFKSWTPSTSSSAPTAGNGTPAPKQSLNTASESTPLGP